MPDLFSPPRRRWFQFRLRALLCAPVIVAIVFGWGPTHRQYVLWRLHAHSGKDLAKLPEEEQDRIERWVAHLIDSETPDSPFAFALGKTWRLHSPRDSENGTGLYVFQMQPAISVPDASSCSLNRIDRWGRLAKSDEFNIGYRAWPESATCDESRFGFLCLEVVTEGMWSGKTRQFHRITDDHVELMRSETIEGEYAGGKGNLFEIEEKPPDWPYWPRLIESPDRIEQLRGLAVFWSYDNQERLKSIGCNRRTATRLVER